jgi:hypothetical protein
MARPAANTTRRWTPSGRPLWPSGASCPGWRPTGRWRYANRKPRTSSRRSGGRSEASPSTEQHCPPGDCGGPAKAGSSLSGRARTDASTFLSEGLATNAPGRSRRSLWAGIPADRTARQEAAALPRVPGLSATGIRGQEVSRGHYSGLVRLPGAGRNCHIGRLCCGPYGCRTARDRRVHQGSRPGGRRHRRYGERAYLHARSLSISGMLELLERTGRRPSATHDPTDGEDEPPSHGCSCRSTGRPC